MAGNQQTFKTTVGLALGSGGPRGLAHIGVIKALEENHIPIDMIVGSSAGSLIGGLYASGIDAAELENIAKNITFKELTYVFGDIGSMSGIIRGGNIEDFLDRYLKGVDIEKLSIPFRAIATNLSTGEEVVIKEGEVSKAIHASSAIPGLFEGVSYQEKLLVDGGISSPVPVDTVREMGADVVIAVNLDGYEFLKGSGEEVPKPLISSASVASIKIMRYNLAKRQCKKADITIVPDVAEISIINFKQFMGGENIIQKGYQATIEKIEEIKEKIGSAD